MRGWFHDLFTLRQRLGLLMLWNMICVRLAERVSREVRRYLLTLSSLVSSQNASARKAQIVFNVGWQCAYTARSLDCWVDIRLFDIARPLFFLFRQAEFLLQSVSGDTRKATAN
jgi:hypothetical protein